jgi:uncharacterized RDD family membrane protein YckC
MNASAHTILTPEHVEIRLVPAGLGRRFLAVLVDALCATALASALSLPASALLPRGHAAALFLTTSFAIGWGWHVFFEVYRHGRTPGKQLLGLRVVDGRGLPLSLEQALVRNVIRALDFLPLFYGLGALISQLDRRRRRLGDLAADTLVIREGGALPALRDLRRSPEFNSLRTPRVLRLVRRRVGVEEAELLLALSLRSDELLDGPRHDLMEEVARHYRERLELGDLRISGPALVRGLAAILFWDRRAPGRRSPAVRRS